MDSTGEQIIVFEQVGDVQHEGRNKTSWTFLTICGESLGRWRVSGIFSGDNLLLQLQTEQTECSVECIST